MSNKQPCAVCPEPGKLRCSRCKSMVFCGTEHQALLWSSHKVICTPNAPLVFKQRPLEFAELLEWAGSTGTRESLEERGLGTMTSFELASRCATAFATGPSDEKLKHSHTVLRQNFTCAYRPLSTTAPKVEAFTLLSFLDFLIECYAEDEGSPTTRLDLYIDAALDLSTRNAFHLQALVMCTLVEKKASPGAIKLAATRLLKIVAEHENAKVFKSGIEDFYQTATVEGWEWRMHQGYS
ncbi:hypothetical protein RQP46_003267 [Phenoliferia psychrophenolica]